ncbi:unnamed protein product [Dracunculus medinensis]|uniref:Uncharacterized protein n=1 Tax=Dracunculus medinensis TaxID=318479 RepID=A0A0N4U4R5_DRAME|nr:unnamed protein product [Dracunculus medinensis]
MKSARKLVFHSNITDLMLVFLFIEATNAFMFDYISGPTTNELSEDYAIFNDQLTKRYEFPSMQWSKNPWKFILNASTLKKLPESFAPQIYRGLRGKKRHDLQ